MSSLFESIERFLKFEDSIWLRCFIAWRRLHVNFFIVAKFAVQICTDEIESVNLPVVDRKSTRLNSSHTVISYAVFCLKKKKKHPSAKAAHGTRLRAIAASACSPGASVPRPSF